MENKFTTVRVSRENLKKLKLITAQLGQTPDQVFERIFKQEIVRVFGQDVSQKGASNG